MQVPLRHPVGIAVGALSLLSLLVLVLASVSGEPMRARREHRRQMRGWTEYHGVRASATRTSFVIETMSAPTADGWYRIVEDRRAQRVSATCGGNPASGCVDGRWRIADRGLVRRYVLGR